MSTSPIKDYDISAPSTQNAQKSPNQSDLTKQMMALIMLMQNVEILLNNGTTHDLQNISDQTHEMSQLNELENRNIQEQIQISNQQLEKASQETLTQKIFAGIASALSVIIGGILVATGAGVGIGTALITTGIIGIICTISPDLIQNAISNLCNDDPAAQFFVKIALVLGATIAVVALSIGTGGAAIPTILAGLMVFGTMWKTTNPTKDAEAWHLQIKDGLTNTQAENEADSSKAVKIANAVIGGIVLLASLITGIAGVASTIKELKGAGKAAKAVVKGVEEGVELSDLSGSSAEIESLDGDIKSESKENFAPNGKSVAPMNIDAPKVNQNSPLDIFKSIIKEGKDKIQNTLKKLIDQQARLNLLFGALMGAAQMGESATSIASGSTQLKMGNIQEEITRMQTLLQQNSEIQEMMNSLLQTVTGFNAEINRVAKDENATLANIFAYQVEAARKFAQVI